MTTTQVHKSHYGLDRYGFEGRFVSYYYQLREVLSRNPDSVVEVGVGDRVFGSFVKNNTDIQYTSVDIAAELSPDIVSSVTTIALPNDYADIACAFEVLEHLPFEEFDAALAELARIARTYVVISLPHFGPMLSFSLKIPLLPKIQWALKLPVRKQHVFNGQHYWEIGKKGFSLSDIKAHLSRIGHVEKEYVPFNSEYHHLFVIRLHE